MAADFELMRRRLTDSAAVGHSVESSVRATLKAAELEARYVAMAMLVAVLRMPAESHPKLHTLPISMDIRRGVITINNTAIVLWPRAPSQRKLPRAECVWSLLVDDRQWDHTRERRVRTVAEFVGLSVMLRAGGNRLNILKWIALIGPP